MYYVYYLQSIINPDRYYVGSTSRLKERVSEHNEGKSIHTNKYKPWKLMTYTAFENKLIAEEFEKYLKTASGRAFAKKHFFQP